MTLNGIIDDVRANLELGKFESEAAVRQSIVERLLRALNWPTHDPQIVFPEYGVENRKVDYALCYPESSPRAFVEAKTIGRIREGI